MENVSVDWIAAHNQDLLPEAFFRASILLTDEKAAQSVTATDNGHDSANDAAMAYNENTAQGYISSEVSQSDNSFATQPEITLSIPYLNTKDINGVTIAFEGGHAVDFTVTSYNGSSPVNTLTVTGNTEDTVHVSGSLGTWNSVKITIASWSAPSEHAQIKQLWLGYFLTLNKSDITNAEMSASGDLCSFRLPTKDISIEIDNIAQTFNPENTSGLYKYLSERQRIYTEYGYKINGSTEWISGGRYWLQSWEIPANGITATFRGSGLTALLDKQFTFPTSGTYSPRALAQLAINAADIPVALGGDALYDIGAFSSTDNLYMSNIGGLTCTCAEALQYIANYSRTVIYERRNGVLTFASLGTLPSNYWITPFNVWESASDLEVTKELKAVKVKYTSSGTEYTENYSTDGEVQEVDNPVIYAYGFVTTKAKQVAQWIGGILSKRKLVSGEFRADPRLDVFDIVGLTTKYGSNLMYITDIKYSFSGAFRGSFAGRIYKAYVPSKFIPVGSDSLVTSDNKTLYCRGN